MSANPFAPDPSWLFVGLGNPGNRYAMTRHNIGFMVVKAMGKQLGLTWKEQSSWPAIVAKGLVEKQTLHLMMPTTYMNASGSAVARYLNYHKLAPANLVVIADDVALPFGALRLREQGGAGGHNGLKSIQQAIGTAQFARLRMGVGDNRQGEDLAGYVLADFLTSEQLELASFTERAVAVLQRLCGEPMATVMNEVNTKMIKEQRESIAQENNHEQTH